jgi:lipoprotein NlpI
MNPVSTEINPSSPPSLDAGSWCEKGRQLMQSKQFRHAIGAFDNAIEVDARYARAYFLRGVCHYLMGHPHLVNADMDAATILGYQDARFWSKFEMNETRDTDNSAI